MPPVRPMDRATIEKITSCYDAFNAQGWVIDADFFLPNVEWRNAPELPGATLHCGLEAVNADLARQGEAWESRYAEPVELHAACDQVVVILKYRVRGKASGVPIETELVHVWTVENGRIRRIEAFLDRNVALAAANLGAAGD